MADENEGTSPEEQALADEWAAALAEAGDDAGQADIDALMAQGGATPVAPAAPRAPMEEFGMAPKVPTGGSSATPAQATPPHATPQRPAATGKPAWAQ